MTPTYRRDRLTGTWRLVAPTRAGVPLPPNREDDAELPASHGRCPFCPGHEEDAGATVARLPSEGPWEVRAVRNRFPAVAPTSSRDLAPGEHDRSDAITLDEDVQAESPPVAAVEDETRLARGAHEVIVETREHEGDLHELSIARRARVLAMYRDRVGHHEDSGAPCVLLFRNRGIRAGSSQPHPHAQVVVSSVVPTEIALRTRRAVAHHRATDATLIDAERDAAKRAGRIVLEQRFGTLLCPHAPSAPYETWLVPHRHRPFATLDDGALQELSELLGRGVTLTLDASRRRAWNLVARLPPRAARDLPAAFWFFAIVPRSAPGAGLELTAGTTVVSVAPEDAAARMRQLVGESRT